MFLVFAILIHSDFCRFFIKFRNYHVVVYAHHMKSQLGGDNFSAFSIQKSAQKI